MAELSRSSEAGSEVGRLRSRDCPKSEVGRLRSRDCPKSKRLHPSKVEERVTSCGRFETAGMHQPPRLRQAVSGLKWFLHGLFRVHWFTHCVASRQNGRSKPPKSRRTVLSSNDREFVLFPLLASDRPQEPPSSIFYFKGFLPIQVNEEQFFGSTCHNMPPDTNALMKIGLLAFFFQITNTGALSPAVSFLMNNGFTDRQAATVSRKLVNLGLDTTKESAEIILDELTLAGVSQEQAKHLCITYPPALLFPPAEAQGWCWHRKWFCTCGASRTETN